ncbi:MAG TPA: hypothetical protein VGR57_20295 [Ktedonobacterales bacterium]|nr:hypothetical protein [Ktedonobacterales bacterium]
MTGTMNPRNDTRAAYQLATAPREAVIGIDCDGVLASDRLLWQVLRKRYPAAIPARYEDLSGYDWPRANDDTTELCLRLSADPAFAGRLAPMPQMAHALRVLHLAGYRLHIVTARPLAVRHATRRWLARHGVASYVSGIECVDRPADKLAVVRALGCDTFVEDNHSTAEALGQAGVRSYLLDAPYNQMPARHSLRVRDWHELLADLLGPAATLPVVSAPTALAG